MIYLQPGWITNGTKINNFLSSPKVKELLGLMETMREQYNLDKTSNRYFDKVDACMNYVINNFTHVEMAFLGVHYQSKSETKITNDLAYLNAKTHSYGDIDFLFPVAYLDASLGTLGTNNPLAREYGLKQHHIEKYQQQWRDFGVEPTKVNWDLTGYLGELEAEVKLQELSDTHPWINR
ncbi:hypothetical protein [Richelia sinica]|uniref:hypothetical protein n=1 Tax=Richelia sinica TaxID=1357545 RepID=UPI00168A1CCC|nr:hypothetical protein [Richelia sinica]MBD2667267.1 hypothetical protein [Richelia sinica FACHB-800]